MLATSETNNGQSTLCSKSANDIAAVISSKVASPSLETISQHDSGATKARRAAFRVGHLSIAERLGDLLADTILLVGAAGRCPGPWRSQRCCENHRCHGGERSVRGSGPIPRNRVPFSPPGAERERHTYNQIE
jgi:hypothetical protein